MAIAMWPGPSGDGQLYVRRILDPGSPTSVEQRPAAVAPRRRLTVTDVASRLLVARSKISRIETQRDASVLDVRDLARSTTSPMKRPVIS